MRRYEKYKSERQYKRNIILSLVVFFILIAAGVGIADFSVNSILKDENSIGVIQWNNLKNNYTELEIMNKKIYINTLYIKNDYYKFKSRIKRMIHPGSP